MKMTILTLLILLISLPALAPDERKIFIADPYPVNIYERLMEAITAVESSGDVWALNVDEQACGPFQIRAIRLADYNRRTGSDYKLWDCFDYELSRKIFLSYTHGRDYESVSRSWNGSGKMTIEYWERVKSKL